MNFPKLIMVWVASRIECRCSNTRTGYTLVQLIVVLVGTILGITSLLLQLFLIEPNPLAFLSLKKQLLRDFQTLRRKNSTHHIWQIIIINNSGVTLNDH